MVVCASLSPVAGHKSVCCVIDYNFQGEPVGSISCIPIGGGYLAADCTQTINFPLLGGGTIPVPLGRVAECCHDCFPPERKLVLSGGRLVRNGGAFATSPEDEPDKCCCGGECVCKEVPDCTHVRCYSKKDPSPDDKCKGRCVIRTYDEDGYEVIDDRQVICATLTQCCADDNTTCEQTCEDGNPAVTYVPPANSWAAMPCTDCGVCCVNNYDEDPTSPTFRQVLSKTGTKDQTQEECEASHPFLPDPANPFGPVGVWYPNTDNVNICNPNCCQQQIRGDEKAAVCAPTSATECDPCLGRCIEIEYENNPAKCPREECKTKQDCCGDGGEKCEPQCGAAEAKYRWEAGCGDGSKCGTCCQAIYNDEGAVIELTCDSGTTTAAECERLVGIGDDPSGNPLPDSAYGSWFPFGTCAECNATPCCREITCEDGSTNTICATVAAADCDFCNGTCLEIETGNKTCAHYTDCCGADGEKCESFCDNVATHSWSDNGCTDPELCGACCRVVYSDNTAGATAIEATCVEEITKASDCKLTEEDEAQQEDGYVISYTWKPFKDCASAKCGTKRCCGEKCPGDVGCIDVDINDECDPCKGRCAALLPDGTVDPDQPPTCQTKQECCGDDGSKCRGCPGTGEAGGAATAPEFAWSGCFENGQLCGICCVITLNSAGDPVSSECEEENYEECIARGANASWKAFESCGSAVCIPRTCCNDEICPGQVICIAIDKDRGECNDPCRSECYAIDETGADAGDPFCATKVDCCGEQNEKCSAQPGFCPDNSTVPSHSWAGDCADGDLCGTCCKKNFNPDGSLAAFTCDDTKTNSADCTAANFGVWYAFGTCAACGNTQQACVETKCKKLVTIDGEEQEITISNATCKPVAPDRTNCNGICTELATDDRPYAVTTCKTREECCGGDDSKCISVGCGSAVTHSFSPTCIDEEKCGVCCIVTNIGDGNLTPGTPQVNNGREACEQLNTATPRFGVGNTTTWIPFGGAGACTGKPCATQCPDGSVKCVNKLPPDMCPEPCNGKCTDSTGAISVARKSDCCVQNGVNQCNAPADPRCPPSPSWTVVCPDNANKCGVACKTIYNGSVILSSECQEAINTYAAFQQAQNGAPPGVTYTWYPWDTCETVICRSKTCCKEICPEVNGCAAVDYNDECEKCSGVCYDAIETVDPATGASTVEIDPEGESTCLTRVKCCGAGNEKCVPIPDCPQEERKIFVSCDNENCPTGNCNCASANIAANSFNFSGNFDEPGVAQSETCSSSLFPIDPGSIIDLLPRSINDPCFKACAQFVDDEVAFQDCTQGLMMDVLPPFEWQPCYPALLSGRQLYGYTERCVFSRQENNGPNVTVTGSTITVLTLHICDGEKLVDVTDTILTKKEGKTCASEYSFEDGEVKKNEYTNETIDPFKDEMCYRFSRTLGAPGSLSQSAKVGACMGDLHEPCSAFKDPKGEIKDPDMIGCPEAFTANPLP